MSQGPIISRAYGFNGYVNVFPAPIVVNRDPVNGTDTGLNGQVWVNPSTPSVFFMANTNTSTWVDVSGGTGAFAALTVNPGPTAITGQFTLNAVGAITAINSGGGAVNISTDTAVPNTTTIGNTSGNTAVNINAGTGGVGVVTTNSTFSLATGTGIINIGNNNTASTINIGSSNTAQKTINIGAGAGATNTITIGTLNNTSAVTINAGTNDLTLEAADGGDIVISNNASANTVQLGTGAGNKQVQVGSSNVGSTLTLNTVATTSGVAINNGATTASIFVGSVSPNGAVTGTDGSIYLRTGTGVASTVLYICTGGTTWTAVTVP